MSFLLILLASFIFTGIVIRTKSIAQGRKGPSVWQPMYDIWKLLRKGSVYSTASSWIFKVAPTFYFASVVVACMVVPVGDLGSTIGFAGDFIFFAYVLGFGKFFTIIGALDTASSFEGMGSAREALFSMLVEPAFFILIGSLGLLTGYTSFSDIFAQFHFEGEISYAIAAIAAFVLLMICMIENSRMPVDDPKTHLELTMIHEVMVLDNSGVDMAMIHQATNMKFALYSALIVNLFIGAVAETWVQVALFLGIELLCAVIVGIIESFMARYRMTHNAQFILVLTSLALLLYFGVK
ncbi:MAG: NADH-quinone oxidoreductase subunit H [Bacteroidales bacterium]|nr:NADH-quinone oxidoreductase subunit H [Bacteroidales bacterium]